MVKSAPRSGRTMQIVDQLGVRTKAHESKRDAFLRVVNLRLQKLEEAIENLQKVYDHPENYDIRAEDADVLYKGLSHQFDLTLETVKNRRRARRLRLE